MQRLNLKFSVADTDRILKLAAERFTDKQIVLWFACYSPPPRGERTRKITASEVRRICAETGTHVRIDPR